MTLAAFILVWAGAGLLALGTFVLTWYDGNTLYALADTVSGSNEHSLTGIGNVHAGWLWYILLGLIAAVALFAMFSSPRDKWIAVIGQLLVTAAAGYAAYLLVVRSARSALETRLMIMLIVVAVLALLVAVLAARRQAWIGALVGILAALAGATVSIWAITTGIDGQSYSPLAWVVPVGYILVLLGSLVSVAVNGKNRTEHPVGRPAAGPSAGTPTAYDFGGGASPVR